MPHVSLYFFGNYRPAHFEAENLNKCLELAAHAVGRIPDVEIRRKLQGWIMSAGTEMRRHTSYSSHSVEHAGYGVRAARYDRDKWLDDATSALPDLPGLDYNPKLS